ncbi:S23-interacting protein, partial [Homalodisca vitripennis]
MARRANIPGDLEPQTKRIARGNNKKVTNKLNTLILIKPPRILGHTNYVASGDLELGRGYVAAPRASVKSVCNYFTSFNTHTPPNEYGSFYVKSAGLKICGPHKTDSRAGSGPRAVGWAALDVVADEEMKTLGCLKTRKARLSRSVSYVTIGTAGTGQPYISYPQLVFRPKAFFALGSPIGMFVTVRGIESLGEDFSLPTCPLFFNIFHPFDPVAYRVESLINSDFAKYSPVLIPHHKGRKRMHL